MSLVLTGVYVMERRTELRGSYEVGVYDVNITSAMRNKALEFAKGIILSDNQYSRLLPCEIRDSNNIVMQQKIEVQRTYIGKLGELVFLTYLKEKGKSIDETGMFDIYEGEENVDNYDFITSNNQTVDVKTGFRNIHKRLLINVEQFDNANKDYYVAVKLNAQDVDSKNTLVDWDNITIGTVLGYAEYSFLAKYAKIQNFGEGPARYIEYNRLLGIDRLAREF